MNVEEIKIGKITEQELVNLFGSDSQKKSYKENGRFVSNHKKTLLTKMEQNQPELVSKLELYQDKCADVLASVFIDKTNVNDINTNLLAESITNAMNLALTPIYEKINKLEEPQKPNAARVARQ